VTFFTPNLLELKHVHDKAKEYGLKTSSWWTIGREGEVFRKDVAQLARREVDDHQMDAKNDHTLAFLVEEGVAQMATTLTPHFRYIFIKCGERGAVGVIRLSGEEARTSQWAGIPSNPDRRYVVARSISGDEILVLQHFPPHPTKVVNSTGAGDSFVGALLASLQAQSRPLSSPEALERLVSTCQTAASLTLQTHASVSPLLSTLGK
jgi:pseudouridine-5'-phosphate glycosidase/pseudouridine kinase